MILLNIIVSFIAIVDIINNQTQKKEYFFYCSEIISYKLTKSLNASGFHAIYSKYYKKEMRIVSFF